MVYLSIACLLTRLLVCFARLVSYLLYFRCGAIGYFNESTLRIARTYIGCVGVLQCIYVVLAFCRINGLFNRVKCSTVDTSWETAS